MNDPVVLYNLMEHALYYREFDNAMKYAIQLDKIVGYEYYTLYVEDKKKNSKIEIPIKRRK